MTPTPTQAPDNGQATRIALYLTLILLLALGLRLTFFSGYVGGDDSAYTAMAYAYTEGRAEIPERHWGLRTGIVLPVAAIYSIFGVSLATTSVVTMLMSLAGVALAYLLGERLANPAVGLVAAYLASIFPMEVTYASQLFPYSFFSFLTTLTLYLVVKYRDERRPGYLIASGVALGIAYTCRVTALYALVFFALYFIWDRTSVRHVLLFALGLGAAVSVELIFLWWQFGDPLARLDVLMSRVGGSGSGKSRELQWFFEPFLRPLVEQEYGVFFFLMLPALVMTVFRPRSSKLIILALWIGPIWLYLSYGSQSPFRYMALRRLPRYQSIVIIPWLVLVACVLSYYSRRVRAVVLAMLGVTSVMALTLDNGPFKVAQKKEITAFIQAHPNASFQVARPIFYDYLFLSGFDKRENLVLVTPDNDRSDELNSTLTVWPDAPRRDHFDECTDYAAIDRRAGVAADTSDAIVVLDPDLPDTLYYRLRRNELVVNLLSRFRDPGRRSNIRSGLKDKGENRFAVYQLSGEC